MRRPRLPTACLVVLLAGCTSEPLDDGDAVAACRAEVPTGELGDVRSTVETDAEAQWYVRLWSDTPPDASRPAGSPNYVCVASTRGGDVVVDSFARTRQERDVPVRRLCDELSPALAAVSTALQSGQDAGPSLVAVDQTLPEPLPAEPPELEQALERLAAEVRPAARAASQPEPTIINAGDFPDWSGLAARVERACG